MQRSREREMRRRKQQQEYVKKTRGQIEPGSAKKEGNALPAPAPGQRMYWDGFQWLPRVDKDANANDSTKSKKMRRLYIGNLPHHLNVTEDIFSKQLFNTMKERNLCNDPNVNPVLHTYFTRDKGADHGFCELATLEETERALQLDGMLVLNVPVSITRPTDAQADGPQGGGQLALSDMPVLSTSAIIRIAEILKVDVKTTKEDYDDVLEDMNEGCGTHGKLKAVFIVRPQNAQKNPELQRGDVYLECATIDEATKIMSAMGHRKYDGREIKMISYDADKYYKNLKQYL